MLKTFYDLLSQGLQEDHACFDWTSRNLPQKKIKAQIIAKSDGIWVGEQVCLAVQKLSADHDQPLKVKSHFKDGQHFKKGSILSTWEGPSGKLLALERPFLNIVSFMGGMAYQTSQVVSRVQEVCKKNKIQAPRITLSRKTLPHYRDASIFSVILGGGFPHRTSLSGGVLIKENHIASAGSISKAIALAKSVAPHGLKIEIEVTQLAEVKQAVASKAEVIMLDNFKPQEIKKALPLIPDSIVVEASGGICLDNVADYCIEGVDVISMGGLTHSVRSLDLSLLVIS
jgi:nicotinate-nucleotide pyrophosphorylase (carboxylating)